MTTATVSGAVVVADGLETVSEGHAGEAGAAVKGVVADGGDGVGNGEGDELLWEMFRSETWRQRV